LSFPLPAKRGEGGKTRSVEPGEGLLPSALNSRGPLPGPPSLRSAVHPLPGSRGEGKQGRTMDFELSDEQRLLKDSVERLTTQRYDFETRKKFMAEPDGWSRDMWRQYAELGLTALPFAEDHGGIGGGPVETMIVMEAFGRALALEPYLATVVLGGGFLRHGASNAVKDELLPKVAAGEALLAFAHIERQARYDL